MPRSCGEALIDLLEAYGVDTVFGIPGVHTLEMYRGLANSSIRHVQARNEAGAGFMADGYARASRRPGVAVVISGPGVTNAATPLGQAYADSIPVLLLSAVTDSAGLGKGWGDLHEITDQEAVTRPLTGLSATASSPNDLPDLLADAFSLFSSRRPRPVHISLPIDVAEHPVETRWRAITPPRRPAPEPEAVAAAAALLLGAESPCLYLGGGAVGADDHIRALVDRLGATVITTNAGKGIVPESHPLNVGGGIIHPPAQAHLEVSDVVLAIGTELAETEHFTDRLPINGTLIRVDIDPAKVADRYEPTIGIVADAALTAAALVDQLGDGSPTALGGAERTAATKEAVLRGLSAQQREHAVALEIIRGALPADTLVMVDMTQIVYTGSAMFPVEASSLWNYPAGYCTLGSGLPSAIGAKLACPDRPVATIVGDGGFQFTAQELIVAAELGLPIPVIIWNNQGLNQITDDMKARDIPPVGTSGMNPDFLKLADAMGARGVQPDSASALHDAITNALTDHGPTVIEVLAGSAWLHSR